MRIVGGFWRGRKITPPSDQGVRPTADRVREAWISIVLPDLPGAKVLDLFAGSGALGLEALSRGASEAHFVESSPHVLRTLRENIALLGAESKSHVHRDDALRFLESQPQGAFDVAFADPPYREDLARKVALMWLRVPFAEILGVEHPATAVMPEEGGGGGGQSGDTRRYGDTAITFYRRQ